MRRLLAAGLVVLLAAPAGAAGFRARAKDFKCLTDGVRAPGLSFYVSHRTKRGLRKAVAVARKGNAGVRYPVGTILQLLPFEAMVKRGGLGRDPGRRPGCQR
jgi:hypothetical protein